MHIASSKTDVTQFLMKYFNNGDFLDKLPLKKKKNHLLKWQREKWKKQRESDEDECLYLVVSWSLQQRGKENFSYTNGSFTFVSGLH